MSGPRTSPRQRRADGPLGAAGRVAECRLAVEDRRGDRRADRQFRRLVAGVGRRAVRADRRRLSGDLEAARQVHEALLEEAKNDPAAAGSLLLRFTELQTRVIAH